MMQTQILLNSLQNIFLNAGLLTSNNAYLDPGSGSFILQLIIASLVGGLFVLKTYWTRIKTFIVKLVKGSDEPED